MNFTWLLVTLCRTKQCLILWSTRSLKIPRSWSINWRSPCFRAGRIEWRCRTTSVTTVQRLSVSFHRPVSGKWIRLHPRLRRQSWKLEGYSVSAQFFVSQFRRLFADVFWFYFIHCPTATWDFSQNFKIMRAIEGWAMHDIGGLCMKTMVLKIIFIMELFQNTVLVFQFHLGLEGPILLHTPGVVWLS